MSATTLQDSLILLRRRAVRRRRRLNAGFAMLAVVGLSLLGWAALWAGAVSVASVLSR
jgi:hypothetical protein